LKKKIYVIVAFILFCTPSLKAQTTEGTEFWLTFGTNGYSQSSSVDLQIRIVAKDYQTKVALFFTNLDTCVEFEIGAGQIYTYVLSEIEKAAVYNYTYMGQGYSGITNYSVHITTNMPVTVMH